MLVTTVLDLGPGRDNPRNSEGAFIRGFEGEILCDDNLQWYCPNCGNRDKDRMNVVRRTCGYLGENFWNEGRTQEIKERVMHL